MNVGQKVEALRRMKVDEEVVPYGTRGVIRRTDPGIFPYLVDFGDVKSVPVMGDEIRAVD